MSEAEITTPAPPPERPWFQFTLRTLLLATVVLASSLAVFGAWGILMFGIAAGLAFNRYQSPRSSCSVAASLTVLCLISFFAWSISVYPHTMEIARCAVCANNVTQIAAAIKQYHKENGSSPPAYIADKSGKPIHSWRVLLLPYLDYDYFKKYSLNEPWNGPNNSSVCAVRPNLFVCPCDHKSYWTPTLLTNYVAVVGQNAAWLGDKPRKLADFGNQAADTIMVIEVANSGIDWSEPRDLSLDGLTAKDAKLAPQPGSNHGPQSDFLFIYDEANGAYAIMADGSIRYLPPSSLTPERLPAMLQIGGCKEGKIASVASSYRFSGRPNWPNIAALAVWVLSVIALLTLAVRNRPKRINRIAN